MKLKKLKADVHVLTLPATPIPRTLQMALTGVREMSLIATPPIDRLAVRTHLTRFDDDVVREVSLVEDYHVEMTETDEQYRLVLTPKVQTVTVWGRIEVSVEKARLIPVEQVYFNDRGDQVRTMVFSDVREFSGKALPALMKMAYGRLSILPSTG